MLRQEIICTVCPMGCRIQVSGQGKEVHEVKGYSCLRGEKYARKEFCCPVRTLTTTVKTDSLEEPLLAVRTAQPIPKSKLFECMDIIREKQFKVPIKLHQVLLADLAGTGIDLIACSEREGGNPYDI
ncbi:DUF1667 domain-containing protein [Lachnospiraceae bacterium 56-18]|jgi:CxxC motif-containing protein